MKIRNFLPQKIKAPLWGNRLKWGLVPIETDPDWVEWQQSYVNFYNANQREGFGTKVNDAGYQVMKDIDMAGKIVLEIGPGDIRHIKSWQSTPAEYILADIDKQMLEKGESILKNAGVPVKSILLNRGEKIPLADGSVDIVVSFYALEHIYPLVPYLIELNRLLKHGGTLVGGIPTEGGFAWGLGRYFTSRRWFKKNTRITKDKIICWEHPNFSDQIIKDLGDNFKLNSVRFWPFNWLKLHDINLIVRFVYKKVS